MTVPPTDPSHITASLGDLILWSWPCSLCNEPRGKHRTRAGLGTLCCVDAHGYTTNTPYQPRAFTGVVVR